MSSNPASLGKQAADFRDFATDGQPGVRDLYRSNHAGQTLEFVLRKKAEYLPPRRRRMGVWEGMEVLSTFIDASDPDLDGPQIDHALQTGESLRRCFLGRIGVQVRARVRARVMGFAVQRPTPVQGGPVPPRRVRERGGAWVPEDGG